MKTHIHYCISFILVEFFRENMKTASFTNFIFHPNIHKNTFTCKHLLLQMSIVMFLSQIHQVQLLPTPVPGHQQMETQ